MDIKNLCMGCMVDRGDKTVCPQCGWKEGTLPESLAQLPPRTVLNNQYLLGKVLGQGGFGITYLAWDMNLERKVAVKEYFPHGLAGRSQDRTSVSIYSDKANENFAYGLSKFMEEGKTLAKFQEHPGIVSVLNFFKVNNTGYLVMEYVKGITFKEYLEQEGGKIPFETALNILMPVMDALREVHEGGLLHRDISPDNIYITEKGRIKLLDFGAARYAMGEQSKSLSLILKEGYAPVEQYQSKGNQGPWTDVYALGATFYRAVTGVVPPQALDRLVEDEFKRPSQIGVILSGDIEPVFMKSLAVRFQERFQSVREFQDSLSKESVEDSEEEKSKPPSETTTKPKKKFNIGVLFLISSISSFLIVGIALDEIVRSDDAVLRGYMIFTGLLVIIGAIIVYSRRKIMNGVEMASYWIGLGFPVCIVIAAHGMNDIFHRELTPTIIATMVFLLLGTFLIGKRKKEANGKEIFLYWLGFSLGLIGFLWTLFVQLWRYRSGGVGAVVGLSVSVISGIILIMNKRKFANKPKCSL